uniref:Uncharacterized protein n=1 Tax=Solanum lycopersicum TaxID=4081 RepID=A0A3Q7J7I9_SOLLC
MPDVVQACIRPKGDDSIEKRLLTVCACQEPRLHAMPDIVQPGVLAKVCEGMPREMLSKRVCCKIAMMDCHVRRQSTACAAQMPFGHATPDVFRSCVLSKGDDNLPRLMSSDCMCCLMYTMACLPSKGRTGMPRTTPYDRV